MFFLETRVAKKRLALNLNAQLVRRRMVSGCKQRAPHCCIWSVVPWWDALLPRKACLNAIFRKIEDDLVRPTVSAAVSGAVHSRVPENNRFKTCQIIVLVQPVLFGQALEKKLVTGPLNF